MKHNNCVAHPRGDLNILIIGDKVHLRRCVRGESFDILSIEDFRKIDNIIDYAKNFKYKECTAYLNSKFYLNDDYACAHCSFPTNDIGKVLVGISTACNFDCYNCFFKGYHKDTPLKKQLYFETLYKIKGHQLDAIELTDRGEPFFYYFETMKYLKSLSLKDTRLVRFNTNLSMFNEERLQDLKSIYTNKGIKFEMLLSIDGITKETYEKSRVNGNFEKTLKNLEIILNLFDKKLIHVNFVIKKTNMSDVPNVIDFFKTNFNIIPCLQYDLYDEDCKKLFDSLNN